jgi:hypothetical protein
MQRARSASLWQIAALGRINAWLNAPLFFDAKRERRYHSRETASTCLTMQRKRVLCSTRMLRQSHGTNGDQSGYIAVGADIGTQFRYHQRLSS